MESFCETRVYDIAEETGVPYTYLLCMMYELKCGEPSEAFYYNQLAIQHLPMKVIKLLWPKDTVCKVVKLFWDVYERVRDMEEAWASSFDSDMRVWQYAYPCVNTWPELASCWLFKTMLEWVNDEEVKIEDRDKIKRTLFDVMFNKQSTWL